MIKTVQSLDVGHKALHGAVWSVVYTGLILVVFKLISNQVSIIRVSSVYTLIDVCVCVGDILQKFCVRESKGIEKIGSGFFWLLSWKVSIVPACTLHVAVTLTGPEVCESAIRGKWPVQTEPPSKILEPSTCCRRRPGRRRWR